jgi:hypothetical protein
MYLFDTDTLSNIVKRKPAGHLLEKLRELPKFQEPFVMHEKRNPVCEIPFFPHQLQATS